MRVCSRSNDQWVFHEGFDNDLAARLCPGTDVTLPHNCVDLPYNYLDETLYQRTFCYQKVLPWRPEFEGREVTLEFDGAMADAEVYLNGERIAGHRDGYTPFAARLTGRLRKGDNLIVVKVDGSENPDIPPFGGRIDYLTYAGIYRDVWLKIVAPVSIGGAKVETFDVLSEAKSVTVRCWIANPEGLAYSGLMAVRLSDKSGQVIRTATAEATGNVVTLKLADLTGLSLWDVDDPVLYEMALELTTDRGVDDVRVRFGFRTAEFTSEGFRLNGRPLKILGLNRHQSFPYVGYAMGRRAQERDAELLKHKLKCNLVRTSHYPQSPWFLDHCDRIGLLVFEEIPGWQHIGGDVWRREAIKNVRRMIKRDWNHPSIVMWGVRINESQDSHGFYVETNRLAHELDPTRQTGGVRYIVDSELLEDVYTMNDFFLGSEEIPGNNHPRIPLRDQREVTGLKHHVPYIITEFGGHMYPTKRFDQEQRQHEHVTRHLQVLNAAYGDPHIAGCIGWCFFDYNTHRDFGSGDRICHHGVTDMFREPKFAAYAYASQGDPSDEIVLKPVTYWARGERNIGGVLPLIVLTNCDEVEFVYGNSLTKRLGPDRETYPHLPHPPIIIDHRHFSSDELGLWGMKWEDLRLTGYLDGRAVTTMHTVANPLPTRLEVEADTHSLSPDAKDSVRIIVRALDQAGNLLPYLDESVHIQTSGPARLLGPAIVTMKGGAVGFWVETIGGVGDIAIKVTSPRFAPSEVRLKACRMEVRGEITV
jgi:beta-galactosidase